MLYIRKVELKLISDFDMYISFEKVMRGKVSSISDRYCKANNKHLKSYESSQELKHIIYLDANNLGGYAMSKFLPTSEFKWMDSKEIEKNGKLRKQNRSKPCKQQNRLFKIDIQTNYI